MFSGHPKGLFVLALTNMGERFGYYTMLAILALYLQAKFGFDSGITGQIFGTFLALVYFLPLLGGIIADKFLGYGKTILLGIIVMFGGYLILATPSKNDTAGLYVMFGALALISLGTGFFKGNLQALVGNLYDNSKYAIKRDVAFSIFYMFINIGAFFAPSAAEAVSNYYLAKDDFVYDARVPDLALKYLNYKVVDEQDFSNQVLTEKNLMDASATRQQRVIQKEKQKEGVIWTTDKIKYEAELDSIGEAQLGAKFTGTADFAKSYVDSLSKSYNWGFGVACISLIISLLIFLIFRRSYKNIDITEKQKSKDEKRKGEMILLTPQQTKSRMIALGLVFLVVIFFWMSFHQNGLTMTFFARDYTNLGLTAGQNLWFSLIPLLLFAIGFYGLFSFIQNVIEKKKVGTNILGLVIAVVAGVAIYLYYYYLLLPESSEGFSTTPPKFQQFNPFFIILLTPIFVAVFSYLGKKGKEPPAPRKIGIGMVLAGVAFLLLLFPSLHLKSPEELLGGVSSVLVSPNWLIGTYFILTIAELFLSPMGISFVSKVAPPQYKGLMQGGWLAATAVGSYLVGVVGGLWDKIPLSFFWGILIICCLISAIFIFSILKRLERATE